GSVTGAPSIARAKSRCDAAETETERSADSSDEENPSAFQTANASPRDTSRIARSQRVTQAARNAFSASTWLPAASIERSDARKSERSAAAAGRAGGGGGGGSGMEPAG